MARRAVSDRMITTRSTARDGVESMTHEIDLHGMDGDSYGFPEGGVRVTAFRCAGGACRMRVPSRARATEDHTVNASGHRFTKRQVTLLLYKAAELQEPTWWLRSVRLALRRPGRRRWYSLDEVRAIAAEMGIEARFVDEAAQSVDNDIKWEAT